MMTHVHSTSPNGTSAWEISCPQNKKKVIKQCSITVASESGSKEYQSLITVVLCDTIQRGAHLSGEVTPLYDRLRAWHHTHLNLIPDHKLLPENVHFHGTTSCTETTYNQGPSNCTTQPSSSVKNFILSMPLAGLLNRQCNNVHGMTVAIHSTQNSSGLPAYCQNIHDDKHYKRTTGKR